MSSRRPAQLPVSDLRWLDKSQAMAYTQRKTEETFDRDFESANRYQGGHGYMYDKKQLDLIITKKMLITF